MISASVVCSLAGRYTECGLSFSKMLFTVKSTIEFELTSST
ncbi:MAG: hypothetical protein U0T80_00910 [Flavobacteriaceae bacterium]